MRTQGFTTGDFDPAFPLDEKFLILASDHPDIYYHAVGVYWTTVAATWREGRPRPASRVAPGANEAAIAALIEAGLLGPDGAIPSESFANWIGAALSRRAEWAEKKRGQRRDIPGTSRGQDGDIPKTERGVPSGQVSTGQDKTDEGGPGGEPDAADSLYIRTGRYPSAGMLKWVNDLAKQHGESRVAALIDSTPMNGSNPKEYLDGISDALRKANHEAERAEAADEIRRNAEKRAPVIVRRAPDIGEEEAQRLAIEWTAKQGRPS